MPEIYSILFDAEIIDSSFNYTRADYNEITNSTAAHNNTMYQVDDVPSLTNVWLAVALYLACLATVFGNTLVIIAVCKVSIVIFSFPIKFFIETK